MSTELKKIGFLPARKEKKESPTGKTLGQQWTQRSRGLFILADLDEYNRQVERARQEAERKREQLIRERDAEVARQREAARRERDAEIARRREEAERERQLAIQQRIDGNPQPTVYIQMRCIGFKIASAFNLLG